MVEAMKTDPDNAVLAPRQAAIVAYALKLTREPAGVRESDLVPMREAGLSDTDILDTCQITCYFAYANRLAQGLGVELEE